MEPSNVETRTDTAAPGRASLIGDAVSPVCVTGMHRSGTSMVARLLHTCGIFLGPEDELNRPSPDNPEGYFESRSFVTLNEDLLAQFGGSWDDPPSFPAGWELSPAIDPLLERAEKLIAQFRRQAWGWKDPRASLTLSFWRRLIPDLKVVVCVRNPLEVSRSLFLRGDFNDPSQYQLWLTYYRQLLAATRPEQRLVTHYRSYFQDPRAELTRVLNWLGLKVADEVVAGASRLVSSGLRHHHGGAAELFEADAPDELLGLYFNLCAEAGPVYRQARRVEAAGAPTRAAAHGNEVMALTSELQRLRETSAAREQLLDEILNSKSFKLISTYWRLRRRK
jgi:hypothetical protein